MVDPQEFSFPRPYYLKNNSEAVCLRLFPSLHGCWNPWSEDRQALICTSTSRYLSVLLKGTADNTISGFTHLLHLVLPSFCSWLNLVAPKPWQNTKVDSSILISPHHCNTRYGTPVEHLLIGKKRPKSSLHLWEGPSLKIISPCQGVG